MSDALFRLGFLDCIPDYSLQIALAVWFATFVFSIMTLLICTGWRGGACCCRNPLYKPVRRTPRMIVETDPFYTCIGNKGIAILRRVLRIVRDEQRRFEIIAKFRDSVCLFGILIAPSYVTIRKKWLVLLCGISLSLLVNLATETFVTWAVQPEQCAEYQACVASAGLDRIPCQYGNVSTCGAFNTSYTNRYSDMWNDYGLQLDDRFFIFPYGRLAETTTPPGCPTCGCVKTVVALDIAVTTAHDIPDGWLCRAHSDAFQAKNIRECFHLSSLSVSLIGLLVALSIQRPSMIGLNAMLAGSWNDCNCCLKWVCNLYTCVVLVLVGSTWGIWQFFAGLKLTFPFIWLLSPLILDSVVTLVCIMFETCIAHYCRCCSCCKNNKLPLKDDTDLSLDVLATTSPTTATTTTSPGIALLTSTIVPIPSKIASTDTVSSNLT